MGAEMNAILLNLGLIPIPPVPGHAPPKPPKQVDEQRRARRIAMNSKKQERREDNLVSAMAFVKAHGAVSVRMLGGHFGWSHPKAADVMQVLRQRGQVKKSGAGNTWWWEPV